MDAIQDDENSYDKTNEISPSKRKRKRHAMIKGGDGRGCKTITLYWKLAERWNEERGILSDASFVEHLLLLRQKYMKLKSRCKCEASSDVESCDSERENINIEMDEEDLSLGDSWPVNGSKQIVKIEVQDDDFIEFDSDDEFINRQNSRSIGRKSDGAILGPYKRMCEICKTVVERGTPKTVHFLSEHSTVFVKCRLCENSQDDKRTQNLVNLSDFYDHLNCDHHVLEIICPFCRPRPSKRGERTSVMDSSKLSRHILEKHSQNLMCRCNVCHGEANKNNPKAEKLIKAISLKSHIALKHTVVKQKRVPCEQCGVLVTLSSLPKHIKNVHTEKIQDENNLCDICGKYFVHLKQHKLSVHKKESWSFKCKTCGKTFAKRYNLEVHSRIHTGEKPYICDICGKGFCQNVELKIHTKTNHGISKRRQRTGAKKKTLTIPVDGAVVAQKDTNTNRLLLPALANKASPSDPSSIQTDALQSQPHGNESSITACTAPKDYVYAVIATHCYPEQVNDILTSVTAAESRTVVPDLTVVSITSKDQPQQLPIGTTPLSNVTWVNQTES